MLRFLTGILFCFSLILFFSVYISPEFFPYAGLLTLLIPLLIILNLLFFFLLAFAKRKLAFLPLLALVLGWKFVGVTFQLNPHAENPSGLSVLTYNVHLLKYTKNGEDHNTVTQNITKWLRDNPSDIKCLQEFYQDYTTPSQNAIKAIGTDVGYEYSYQVIEGNPTKRSYGMIIFSKYPIINEGRIFENNNTNGVIYADVKIEKDTVRIYNAHLESMSISSEGLSNLDGIKENYRETLGKLKRGQIIRASQLEILKEHMRNSPYANILVGDFNDVPYSYTYFSLRKLMKNAFETAGRGFGFTYNKVLFFLRIDNIFYDDILQVERFKTHREVDYSDHYPISATFNWDKPLQKINNEQEMN
ncbi:endonuclease/exonuclease/phosphatase family protein [Belliella sp. DSM 107340]|uniref:Endonuclease/exonuclease/phosphatase family protein n=1 Tax=Belliella calami TaxID=2923436 RepID=A0ABS9UKQ1_9BACT|nr:endonuclease/exonuclease/phosphatase family protein [Belliella calami]MCH7397152.1 endonuclease/exonuclease/phosphatase family protein [Belliella calami]